MKKILNLFAYNLKKDRSSYISFGIILLITALILNCSAVLLFQVDAAYDEKFTALNTAAVNVLIPSLQDSDKLLSDLMEIEGVADLERHEALLTEATVKEFNGTDFSMNTVFFNIDSEKDFNRFTVISESEQDVANPIYIPLYASAFGGFQPGDEILYVIDGKTHAFTVAGVIEEMQYGNYGSGLLGAYLPEEGYLALKDTLEGSAVTEYSLMLDENANLNQVKVDISETLENKGVMMLSCLDSESVKSTRTMVCNLLILILAAFALIILAVSVFLSNFRVKNAIESEMVNMSVLKALGYTSSQIMAGIALPYVMVSVVFALAGIGVSYLVLPVLSDILTFQSGFACPIRFDGLSLVCVACVLTAIVAVFTFLSAGKIKKTAPIDGLRGNPTSKKGKKNPFPLDTARGGTQLLLILKQIWGCKKQNVLLFLVSFVLTVLIAFSGTFLYNVAIEPDNFMSALSDETPDVIVVPKDQEPTALLSLLKEDSRVENTLQYLTGSVKIDDKAVTVFACEDFGSVRNDACYRGEHPKASDEIALGSAFDGNYKIGDAVFVKLGDQTRRFTVTGFVQSVNAMGELCELSLEGYESLCAQPVIPSIYVYAAETANTEALASDYKEDYPELVSDTVNARKLQEEAQKLYMDITTILVIVIFAITILIVLFILYIVIKSLLVKRRQELGIYKAMGYTSAQLILQTAGSFVPVSVAAILLSGTAALVYMPRIYQVIFEALGVMKNNIEISFGFLMLFAAAQILVNIIISILLCMPIRKISAYALIKE